MNLGVGVLALVLVLVHPHLLLAGERVAREVPAYLGHAETAVVGDVFVKCQRARDVGEHGAVGGRHLKRIVLRAVVVVVFARGRTPVEEAAVERVLLATVLKAVEQLVTHDRAQTPVVQGRIRIGREQRGPNGADRNLDRVDGGQRPRKHPRQSAAAFCALDNAKTRKTCQIRYTRTGPGPIARADDAQRGGADHADRRRPT